MTPALEARGLRVVLEGAVEALRDVELVVRPGELVGVLGPNGAGKSTLGRALAGLVAPTAGTVLIHGQDATTLGRREASRRVAFLPQEAPADVPFTAAELVLMGRAPHLGRLGLDGPADRERAARALEQVHALALAHRPLGALSGGERRRILFARILVQDAPTWVLDEPTAHLDLAHQGLVLHLTRAHVAAGGAALCVLHDPAQAAEVCDRVVVLEAGRIAVEGVPGEALTPERLAAIFGVPFARASLPGGGGVLVPRPPLR